MDLTVVGTSVGMFAVTNVDDIVVLTVFLGQATGRGGAVRVTAGEYLGFVGILTAAVVGAAGAGLLSASVVAYLGLVPLTLRVPETERPRRPVVRRRARSTLSRPPRGSAH